MKQTTKPVVNIRRNFDGAWQWKEGPDENWMHVHASVGLSYEQVESQFSGTHHVFKLKDVPHPTSYTCQINEYQRKMLVDLMAAVKLRPEMVQYMFNQPGDINENMYVEFSTLCDLLGDLPKIEVDNPGVTHGLCL